MVTQIGQIMALPHIEYDSNAFRVHDNATHRLIELQQIAVFNLKFRVSNTVEVKDSLSCFVHDVHFPHKLLKCEI